MQVKVAHAERWIIPCTDELQSARANTFFLWKMPEAKNFNENKDASCLCDHWKILGKENIGRWLKHVMLQGCEKLVWK